MRIKVDNSKKLILVNGKSMRFPRLQFEMINLMSANPGVVYSRDHLMSLFWIGLMSDNRTVDVQIANIRKQLGKDTIETVVGFGYAWKDEEHGNI